MSQLLIVLLYTQHMAESRPISDFNNEAGTHAPAVVSSQGFFQVTPANEEGVSCMGAKGKLSLYLGGTFTVAWSPTYFADHHLNPTSMNLYLTHPDSVQTFPIATNVSISSSTSNYQYTLPNSFSLSAGASFSLQGNFWDANTNSLLNFPTTTTDVVILSAETPCDLQIASSNAQINVPLAIGLGTVSGLLVVVLSCWMGWQSHLQAARDRKGKYWMDGPRSNLLPKTSVVQKLMRRTARLWPLARKDSSTKVMKANIQSLQSESSGSRASNLVAKKPSTSHALVNLSNQQGNPFMTEDEVLTLPSPLSSGTSSPKKSDDYNERPSRDFLMSRESPSTSLLTSKTLTSRVFGKLSAISSAQESSSSSAKMPIKAVTKPKSFQDLQKTTVQDPITGHFRTFVFLDTRGPPERNSGGSSRWAPEKECINRRHRVLVPFNATNDDELTL
ncbi:hypothetical protein BC830DRAFT_1109835, partial [Chytriomyces sp. MP71]